MENSEFKIKLIIEDDKNNIKEYLLGVIEDDSLYKEHRRSEDELMNHFARLTTLFLKFFKHLKESAKVKEIDMSISAKSFLKLILDKQHNDVKEFVDKASEMLVTKFEIKKYTIN